MNLLDNDEIPLSVFIDLSKAFDTLDHKILLHKLQFYGFDNISLLWFQNYLTNRQQYVQVEDFTSHLQPICTGVPQGSILGPLLFIIYVNDIHYASNIFKLTMYADDTTLLAPLSVLNCNIKSNNICSDYLNKELEKIHNWFSVNKLSQNVTKTKYMIFHFPQRKIDSKPTVIMNNIEVQNVTEFNFLGVTINDTLSWSSHLNIVCNKLSRCVGVLRHVHKYVSPKVLILMYNSLFGAHINYGLLAWGLVSERILRLQKKAVRIICRQKFNAHTKPLFKQLNILQIEDLFYVNALKFYFKYLKEDLPIYFNDMFRPLTVYHSYYTRYRDEPQFETSNKISASKCIRYYIPSVLATAPNCIMEKFETHSLQGFVKYVKQHLLSKYEVACTIPNCYSCS